MPKLWIALLALLLAGGCSNQPEIVAQGPRLAVQLERTWLLGEGPGRQASFSHDGTLLAIADASGGVVVRRTSDWRPVSRLHHDGGATAVAFGPGKRLLTAGYDGLVRSWDLGTSLELKRYPGAHGTLWSLDVSLDGARVAAAGEDAMIRVWPIDGATAPVSLKGHQRNVWQVRFSPDGQRIASGSFDQSAGIWDSRTGQLRRTLKGHEQAVVALDFSSDGKRLVTGGDDSTIRVWRTADGAPLSRVDAGNHIYSVALSGDGRWLASGGRARGGLGTFLHQLTGVGTEALPVKLWRTSDMALVAVLPHPDDVMSVSFSPDGLWLVTSSEDRKARLWRITVEGR